MNSAPAVWAVVVTYHPDPVVLGRLLEALSSQVARIVVVDNGSNNRDLLAAACHRMATVELVPLEDNTGIARAQNVGLLHALDAGASQVVLFDQDSVPEAELVPRLQSALATLTARGVRVGAVGANYAAGHHTPFRRVRGPFIRRCACAVPGQMPRVDFLIASGCLIPAEVLGVVGHMREDLFIDYVDIEWSLRARVAGFELFGACDARMQHRPGDSHLSIAGRPVSLHSPLRRYYMFRNALWLYRQGWVPWRWKLADGINLVARFFLYAAAGPARWQQLRSMLSGLADGMDNRLGRRA